MSHYPVYRFVNNNNTPYTRVEIRNILQQPGVRCVDAINGNTLPNPPTPNDLRADGQHFHVGNYYPQQRMIVYHGGFNPYS